MAESPNINEVARNEHIGPGQTGDNIDAKRTANYNWDSKNAAWTRFSRGLVPVAYDYLSYSSGTTTDTYTYYSGGSGGTLVATITVTWTDSTKTVLSSVART